MRAFQRLLAATSFLFPVVGASGCGPEQTSCAGDCDDSLDTATQPAFAVGGFQPWPRPTGPLRLCFASALDEGMNPIFSEPEVSALRDHITATLNDTWGNVPGLDFVANCDEPKEMNILLDDDVGSGVCGLGNGSTCRIGGDPEDLPGVEGVAIHEVGHGLGLVHEHMRPDADPLCPNEQKILDGCLKCQTPTCTVQEAIDCWFFVRASSSITVTPADQATATSLLAAGDTDCTSCSTGTCPVGSCDSGTGTCTPADSYWGCFGVGPTAGTVNTSASDQGNAAGRVSDRSPDPNGTVLTRFDPLSIMNYCSGPNGRIDDRPTEYDMLGMEILYSFDRVYRLGCGVGCFKTSTGVVTSTTGSIVSEWIERGSLGIPFRRAGETTDVFSYSVASLPNGNSTFSYTFEDVVGNDRGGSGTLRKSNPSYAALAGAIAMIY